MNKKSGLQQNAAVSRNKYRYHKTKLRKAGAWENTASYNKPYRPHTLWSCYSNGIYR